MDAGEKKPLADIEQYGCHVIHVLEEEEGPPFSYSVGVQKTSGAPEVMVITGKVHDGDAMPCRR